MTNKTKMMDVYSEEKKEERAKTQVPLQRLGLPEDIGDAVSFLCSDKARFITGDSLMVNGGYFIR